jgi:hypothetical protein
MKLFSRITIIAQAGILLAAVPAAHAAYRNVASNPGDVHSSVWTVSNGYPHTTSNSEYPYPPGVPDVRYMAKNAINGDTANAQEATMPFAAWGPQKISGLWWRVEFGKPLEIDKIVFWIRADWVIDQPAPHDSYWKSATLVFSDSSKVNITIDSTAIRQTKTFTKRTSNSFTITNLVPSNPNKWCALTEMQVWGDDPQTQVRSSSEAVGRAPVMEVTRTMVQNGRLTVAPNIRSVDFYSVDGRKISAWRRTGETGAAEIRLPGRDGIMIIRTSR